MRRTFPRMAGGHGHVEALQLDPGLVKYNQLNVDRYKYFRWTPRTAWLTIAYVFAFPSIITYFAYTTDGKYEMRGKRRGDTIAEF